MPGTVRSIPQAHRTANQAGSIPCANENNTMNFNSSLSAGSKSPRSARTNFSSAANPFQQTLRQIDEPVESGLQLAELHAGRPTVRDRNRTNHGLFCAGLLRQQPKAAIVEKRRAFKSIRSRLALLGSGWQIFWRCAGTFRGPLSRHVYCFRQCQRLDLTANA
ncbi:hypothetical protein BDW66DRAFT_110451 [Aspergillus desertorum]